MGKRHPRQSKFLNDGHRREVDAMEPEIRHQVVAEFEDQLRGASLWRRFWIRRRIERQIRKRLAQKAPADGLY